VRPENEGVNAASSRNRLPDWNVTTEFGRRIDFVEAQYHQTGQVNDRNRGLYVFGLDEYLLRAFEAELRYIESQYIARIAEKFPDFAVALIEFPTHPNIL
jgi:hypothetical protein